MKCDIADPHWVWVNSVHTSQSQEYAPAECGPHWAKCTTCKLEPSRDRITRSKNSGEKGIGSSQWQNKPWEPHRSTNHLAGNVISSNPLGSPHWSPVLLSDPVLKKKHSIPVFATSREVKQKFLVIWEGLEPWCFLFHILFLSPPLSGYSINNAKDLVARGAMGDGFTKSPLPGAITSEGKSSQGTGCSLIGSPVAGQRLGVNNRLYHFPCDGPQENR